MDRWREPREVIDYVMYIFVTVNIVLKAPPEFRRRIEPLLYHLDPKPELNAIHYRYVSMPSLSIQFPTDHHDLEHMEEDEETPKAIPPWVELEYAVSQPHSSTTGNKKESPTYT